MPVFLPDVNVLVALLDRSHAQHASVLAWFTSAENSKWATCTLTENGLVRVLASPAYTSVTDTVAGVTYNLQRLKEDPRHTFWEMSVPLTDASVFDTARVPSPRQLTDVYLLGLAQANRGTLVTCDAKLTARAIHGAREDLIRRLG